MNDLQQILEMWKKDSVINDMALDESSRDSAKLHGKYLEILSINKMKLKKAELEFKVLLRDKWKHYNGKLSQERIYENTNHSKILKKLVGLNHNGFLAAASLGKKCPLLSLTPKLFSYLEEGFRAFLDLHSKELKSEYRKIT